MGNVLDRIVGWINPRAGLLRHYQRQQLTRAYEAASPRDPWRPRRGSASANADHMADATAIRTKARFLAQNVPYIQAALQGLVDATIGTGVIMRSTGREALLVNETLATWSKECDADGRLDLAGILAAAYLAMEQDGEVLVRKRMRRPTDGLAVPLQLQLLEIDWLDNSRTGMINGNQVINGIEYDMLGAVVAYWLWDQHPGDVLLRGSRTQSKRIEAQFILHLFRPGRPGQGRGFSRMAPVIVSVRDLQLYQDGEANRKNLESRLGVIYSGDASQIANPAADGAPVDVAQVKQTGSLGELASGGIMQVPAGGSLEVVTPQAVGGYTDYVKQVLHLIAAGMGVTYEMMTGDVSETNFSSARVRLLDFRRAVSRMQWTTLKPQLLDPIFVAFIDAGILAGKFRARDYAVDYSFPKWEYVDPAKDVAADLAEVSGGLSSISEKIRLRGYNPAVVFQELADDINTLRELNILDVLLFKETKKPVVDPAAAAASAQDATARAESLARIEARVAGLEQRSTEVHIHQGDTNVAPAAVTNEIRNEVQPAATTVNVAPAAVTNEIRNEIQPAATTIHVEPAAVEVRNEVQPGVVQVLPMPARTTVTEVQRGADNRITRTTTTDKPAA